MNRKLISFSVTALLILPGAGLYAAETDQGNRASVPSQFTPLQKRPQASVKGMPAKPAEIRMLPHTDTRTGPQGQPLITVPAPPPPATKPGAEGPRSLGPASKAKAAHYREGELIVVFKKGIGVTQVRQSLAASNLTLAKRFDKLSAKTGKTFALVRGGKGMKAQDLLTLMKKNPLVEAVSLNYGKRINNGGCPGASPNDSYFNSYQWPLCNYGQTGGTLDADIDATEAWVSYTGSTGVIMAVLDTGVDYNHPDLHANMWVNPGEIPGNGIDDDGNGYVDDIYGIDTGEHDSDPMDIEGHGTHVAGTLGAVGNNGQGVVGHTRQFKS